MDEYPKKIYLAATWRGDQRAETVQLANLIARQGFTVVRDHDSNKTDDPLKESRTWITRIDSMLKDCAGVVVVLPWRRDERQGTSPYIVPEIVIGDRQNIPVLVLANPGVELHRKSTAAGLEIAFGDPPRGPLVTASDLLEFRPGDEALDGYLRSAGGFAIRNASRFHGPHRYPNGDDPYSTLRVIEDFVQRCPDRGSTVFAFNVLPFSKKESLHRVIASQIFKSTGLACHLSLDATSGETSARKNWESMLKSAEFVIADMSDPRRACLFEVGYAIGMSKRVFVVSHDDQSRLPFGLDDQRFHKYDSAADLKRFIDKVCCAAFRREVFNLSAEFDSNGTKTGCGVPGWLDKASGLDASKLITLTTWSMCLSVILLIQIGYTHFYPDSPKPPILAVLSAAVGVIALTRIEREKLESRIGPHLRWLSPMALVLTFALFVIVAWQGVYGSRAGDRAVKPSTAVDDGGK
ncbi:MAG: hypothetical protein IPH13_01460 [Planctomycetes bacterium]|nr:hypothetical protein [Planctomycetota bacterium]MCC7171952.1 hypothetical protein [Planctomycetota bacterium]